MAVSDVIIAVTKNTGKNNALQIRKQLLLIFYVNKIAKIGAYCALRFVYYTLLILLLGTILGGVGYMALGKLFVSYDFITLCKKGMWAGFRYGGVWAGGVAIVLTFIDGKNFRDRLSI